MIGTKRQRAKYVVGDFFSTNLACLLFNVVRYYFDNQIVADYGSLTRFLSSPMVVVGQVVFPLVLLGVYYLSGYYNVRIDIIETWIVKIFNITNAFVNKNQIKLTNHDY